MQHTEDVDNVLGVQRGPNQPRVTCRSGSPWERAGRLPQGSQIIVMRVFMLILCSKSGVDAGAKTLPSEALNVIKPVT